MIPLLTCIVLGSVAFLLTWFVYDGYLRLLVLAVRYRRPVDWRSDGPAVESVTIFITAHNEAETIEARVRNALEACRGAPEAEVLVVSDGSTDETERIVRSIDDSRVRFHQTSGNVGKTAAQNEGMELVRGEVVVFTDADSSFAEGFLDVVTEGFRDPRVGLVDCQVRFDQGDGSIGENQSRYWRFEQSVRRQESDLGILAVASGAGLSIRRSLIRPMREDVGEDCLLPLQVVEQGFLVRHMSNALVVDRMPASTQGELRARSRMTARNIRGTLSHPRLLNPLGRPGVAMGLWSHKLLRWLSPVWLGLLIGSVASIAGIAADWTVSMIIVLAIMGFGWASIRALGSSLSIPGLGALGAFSLANLGFAVGIVKAMRGTGPRYRNR